jgi:putative tryptophan/tyrosine transport system substrate-binding protein
VDRRRFLLTTLAGALAGPLASEGQQAGKVWRIGSLSQSSAAAGGSYTEAFLRGLRESGYIEGQDFVLELRYAAGRLELLPDLADELAGLKVDVIFARSSRAVTAARNATGAIPIVALDLESDPIARGFVTSIARPSGNITGMFLDLPELIGKQLELLKEVVPKLSGVAVLGDSVVNASHFRAAEEAARRLAVRIQVLEARNPADFDAVFETATKGRARALIVLSSSFTFLHNASIAALAAKNRLATISIFKEFVEAGGLMAYGIDLRDLHWRCAAYVGKILKGAKPGELPVERPTRFEFFINLKTAKALGLTIPPSLLLRADQVIE